MPQVAVDASGNKIRWDEKKKSWVPVERASDSSGNIVEFDGVKWNPVKQEAKSVAPAGANKTIAESIKGGDIPIPFTAPETGTEPIWTTPVFNKGYWEQVGSGSYWTDAYRNLMRGAKEMEPMSVYTKTMGKTIGMMLAKKQFDKKYGDKAKEEYAKQVSPETAEKIWPSSALGVAGEAGKGLAKGAFDFVTWLPKTAYNFVRDPLTTLREDPLGTIFLFSGVSAGAKTLWKKHKSGKVILPKELRGLEAELKTWAMSNKDSAQKYAQIIESAQKRESLAKEMSPGVSEVSAGVEFGDPLRSKTGVSPRAVRGPGVPTEAAAIAERLKPVPVGEVSGGSPVVSGPTREFDVSGFNRVMPGQPAVSGPGVEWGEPGSVKLPPAKKPPIAISEEPVPGLTEITPPKVLDITSSQMKLGLDEFENLKKAYSGFPIFSEFLKIKDYAKYLARPGIAREAESRGNKLSFRVVRNQEEAASILGSLSKESPGQGFFKTSVVDGYELSKKKPKILASIKRGETPIFTSPYPTAASYYRSGADLAIAIEYGKDAEIFESSRVGKTGGRSYSSTFPDSEIVIDANKIKRVYVLSPEQSQLIADHVSAADKNTAKGAYKYSFKDRDAEIGQANIEAARNLEPVVTNLGRPFLESQIKTKSGLNIKKGDRVILSTGAKAVLKNRRSFGDTLFYEVSGVSGELPDYYGSLRPDLSKEVKQSMARLNLKEEDIVSVFDKETRRWVSPETKNAYSGFPILSEDLMKYIKSGRLVPAQKQENVPGAIKPAPAKVVGMGDFKTDIPRYTTKPRDKSIADPFKVEKNAGGMETGMPGYKHELDSLLKQRDMAATQIKHEYENPVRWFDNSPFLKETLYYPWREAHNQHMFEKIGFRKEIDLWKSKVNGKKAEHDLGAYAIAKQKNGPETLQLMGIDPADVVARVEADPAMMKVYDTARVRLEEMFVRINKSRELLGMSPLPKVENYFTFARGVTDLSSMGINPVTISDPAMIKRHLYEPTFQYKKRENVIGPMSTKFFGIYEHYMNSASKYSLYSPVVAKGRVLLGDWNMTDSLGRPAGAFNLKETAPNLYNMTSEWVDRIAGKSLKTNSFVSKMLGALARNTGTAVIAFNPRSALIQPTSLANTYVEVGAKNLIKGIEEFAIKSNRKLAMRESKVLTGRAMDFHLEDLWAEGVSGAINKGKAKASEVGSYPLRLLDAISAKMSWLAGVERGKQLGLTGKELYRYADDVVVKTQASAAIGDVARVQTTPIGKLGTIFQTFVINNWNYWSKEVFGWKNPNMATPDRVKKVSRLILSAILINSLFEDVIGINSPLPAPEREIIDGIRKGESVGKIGMNVVKEIGESIPFVGGAIKYTDDKFQSYPPIVQQGVDMSKLWSSIQRAVGKGDIKAFSVRDWEMVAKIIGVPGGAVAGQMYRKAQAGMPWWKILMGAPSQKATKSYPTSIPR